MFDILVLFKIVPALLFAALFVEEESVEAAFFTLGDDAHFFT